MRTSSEIREDIESVENALTAFAPDEPGADLPGVQMMRRDLEEHRAALVTELRTATASDLTMVLDGPGVAAGLVEALSLVERLGPVARLVNSIAQSFETGATLAGLIPAEVLERANMLVAGTLPGSFGLHLVPPPFEEQMTLFDEEAVTTLFERSVDQMLDIIDGAGAGAGEYEQAIVDGVSVIGPRAIGHLVDLAKTTGDPRVTRIELLWRHHSAPSQRRTVLNAARGQRLQEVLSSLATVETNRPISGRLVEASLPRRTFGVQPEDGDVVRGSVHENVAHRIEEYFGKDIAGTVTVVTTRSEISGKSKERFTLIEFAGPLE